jgi:hypothetical protein
VNTEAAAPGTGEEEEAGIKKGPPDLTGYLASLSGHMGQYKAKKPPAWSQAALRSKAPLFLPG